MTREDDSTGRILLPINTKALVEAVRAPEFPRPCLVCRKLTDGDIYCSRACANLAGKRRRAGRPVQTELNPRHACHRCGEHKPVTLLYRLPVTKARYLCEPCWLDWTEGKRKEPRKKAA